MKTLSSNSRPAIRGVTKSKSDSYVAIDFDKRLICPSYYKLRYYLYSDRDALHNWRLEGCQEGSTHAMSTSTVTEEINTNNWDGPKIAVTTKEKDITEQNNANETEDEEDDKHSKESLKDQWKALFKTIVFERGNRSRDIDTKAIPKPEAQELILSLYEQLEINNETTLFK
ncbi:hypothetical protein RFI_21797 [Reticulomyxa filosa]|uniref:Uncharacterized protein n=1 Tax=Reticulomyxa filosa TaxID=46433 RepID=X6MPG3_RETFI|nr:hypothetical protein RFI_21797 [Reticulomyxa filosa]|eukprot:ETO15566.1 hypothetical protein RFI_21797 [Reticulomyxa filosa]